jgi:hypothetical protein
MGPNTAGAARGAPAVDYDPDETEVSAVEEGGRSWGVGDVLAVTFVAAAFLIAVGYVVAAIIEEVGGQIPTESVKAYTLLLATDWAAPYYALLPIAAVAIAWWMLRRPDGVADVRRLLRARSYAVGAAVMLAVMACAAVGCAIGNFIVYNNPAEVAPAQLWASEAERIANAIATLAVCGAGIAAAFLLWGAVRAQLAGPAEELADPVAEPPGPVVEEVVTG